MPTQPVMARPTDRTSRRSCILGQRCATEFRRAAEKLDEKNRTDHGLHTPDKFTCSLQCNSTWGNQENARALPWVKYAKLSKRRKVGAIRHDIDARYIIPSQKIGQRLRKRVHPKWHESVD